MQVGESVDETVNPVPGMVGTEITRTSRLF